MDLRTKNNLLIYMIPALTAFLVRVQLFVNWWDSPVRWYCKVGGLDMKTVLESGRWLYNGEGTFTLYKAMLAAILFFNNGIDSPEAVIVIQLIGGVIIAPLTAWCTFRICGNRYWAMISGLLIALYAPAMMYQVLVLKESILMFFALLSFAAVLWTHKQHFSKWSLSICGALLALACICRINALPFCGLASIWLIACMFKKFKADKNVTLKKTSFLIIGMLAIFLSVSIINAVLTKGNYCLPIQSPISYVTKVGGVVKAQNVNVPFERNGETTVGGTEKTVDFVFNMLRKIPAVFSASEIPNNVNYYFLKNKLFSLSAINPILIIFPETLIAQVFIIGPLLLLPLAVSALILLLLKRRVLRKESILFVFIFSYMLPMCYFLPLARYRLVMIPVFCMLAPYPVFAMKAYLDKNKRQLTLIPIIIWLMIMYINLPVDSFVRASDFVTYGKGIQYKTGNATEALPYFNEAYKRAPYMQMTVINLADALLKNRDPAAAVAVLLPAYTKSPKNIAYAYYLGIAYFFSGKPDKAEEILRLIDSEKLGDLKGKYYFFYNASLKAQGKQTNAKQ